MRQIKNLDVPILNRIIKDPEVILKRGKPFIDLNTLGEVIETVVPFLNKQKAVIQLSDKFKDTYVVGDIHGDSKSLLRITDKFLKGDIKSIVFLGDYVDRGEDGLFVLIYLIALYLHFPNHVQLLRGNHEDLELNKRFGFDKEMNIHYPKDKYTANSFLELYYNNLSVAAISPNGSLLVHGGIPKVTKNIADLIEIPKPYFSINRIKDSNKREFFFNGFIELQWSDPAEDQDVKFNPSWRGSGFMFNEEALDEFLEVSNLKRVIRAHESMRGGYQVLFGGKLIHVFSSEPYFGKIKKASVIHETEEGLTALDLNFKPWQSR